MTHSVKISLGEFARDALAGAGPSGAKPVTKNVVRAIRCYLNDKGSGRMGWSYPTVLRERARGGKVKVELNIDDALWRQLEKEARHQGISSRQLVEHAALYLAAELDAGRVTERILEGLDEEIEEESAAKS